MRSDFSSLQRTRRRSLLAGLLVLAFSGLAHAQVSVTSPETTAVKGRAPTVATATITFTGSGTNGEVIENDVLTAVYTIADLDGDTPDATATAATVQWTVDGVNAGTAGSATYVVQAADSGKTITYKLVPKTDSTTTDPFEGAETVASTVGPDGSGTDPGCTGSGNCGGIIPDVGGRLLSVAIAPTDPVVGTQLTATATCVAACSGVTFQWQLETATPGTFANIAAATSATYTPVKDDQKRRIKVIASQP